MGVYTFTFNDKTYELSQENCEALINDEDQPVHGLDLLEILKLLEAQEEPSFDTEYFDRPCEHCLAGKKEKAKAFKFLETHFYIFTMAGEYVTSSISKEFESYSKLLRKEKIDNSYIVSVIVCENCGHYSVEIEQFDI